MRKLESEEVEYYENEKEFGLNFYKGIDPKELLKAIREIDR